MVSSGASYVVCLCMCSFMLNEHLWRVITWKSVFSYTLLKPFVGFSVNECEPKGWKASSELFSMPCHFYVQSIEWMVVASRNSSFRGDCSKRSLSDPSNSSYFKPALFSGVQSKSSSRCAFLINKNSEGGFPGIFMHCSTFFVWFINCWGEMGL